MRRVGELIEQGEPLVRPYEERQRHPADVAEVEGMGPITAHARENLLPCDRGVSLFRRKVRRLVRDLADGKRPPQPSELATGAIPTYGCDTVLRLPDTDGSGRRFLRAANDQVMALKFAAEALDAEARDRQIIEGLEALERDGLSVEGT